jgi:hypothetical protein
MMILMSAGEIAPEPIQSDTPNSIITQFVKQYRAIDGVKCLGKVQEHG